MNGLDIIYVIKCTYLPLDNAWPKTIYPFTLINIAKTIASLIMPNSKFRCFKSWLRKKAEINH